MNKYAWKIKSLAKDISADKAAKELERIKKVYGVITPEVIVRESKNKDSVLHNYFEWDNDKAAENYRIQQARNLINNITVTVIHHGEPKEIGAYEVVNVGDSRTYKNIESLTKDDIEQIKKRAIEDLRYLKKKLSIYDDFKLTVIYIGKAISLLDKK